MIGEVLITQNHWLLAKLAKLESAIVQTTIPPELKPYHETVLGVCQELSGDIAQNLSDLSLGQANIVSEILSNTQACTRSLNLLSTRYAYPLLRATDADRLSLHVIEWMHSEHPETRQVPPAFFDGAPAVWPVGLPIYLLPCLDRQSLLFQPLLFHEFGHVLYVCHQREMDDLVRALQQNIRRHIVPASARNDRYASKQKEQLQTIVDVWYLWIQELFCDATGLMIGGPSYLQAFSAHLRMLERADLVQSVSNLQRSSHPVTWLRVQLLAARADSTGYVSEAQKILNEWAAVAQAMGTVEDYHGYYDAAIKGLVSQTIEDMLIEAAPRPCTPEEAGGGDWRPDTDSIIRLLNWAWQHYVSDSDGYAAWEADAIGRYLAAPLPTTP